MSRYDYRDPGTDPAYCDGLSDPPADDEIVESRRVTPADTAESNNCPWCGGLLSQNCEIRDEWWPYCGATCAMNAEQDNALDG